MNILTRPILEINLNNLLDNYKMLANLAKNATPAAVIKDEAYGLGAKIVAKKKKKKANCRNFFAAHAVEVKEIAATHPNATFYILQGVGADSIEIFRQQKNIIPVISSPEVLKYWEENKPDNRKVAIQVETGLNRLGFREDDLKVLPKDKFTEFSLVMSHLACGDEKDHFMNAKQIENFERIKKTFFPNTPASLSASDGVFLGEKFHQNMVRLGAAVYGINTAPYRQNQMKNVVRVLAPVLQVTNLHKGDFVGYSATYRAGSERKIAIVSIGYGDGLPRSLSNVGKIFLNNGKIHEARIIGRVSMDNIICDVTDISDIKAGDLVSIADDFYTLDDVARDAGTISYEIMSRLGKNPRFERIYIQD